MHDALKVLLADGVIDEVVARLKSGKEADVYIVTHGGQYVAAKIYKERNQRNFKNNAGYKEGRLVRNSRTRRAMEKGSRFGQAAAEEEWKATESEALSRLFAAGVRVPAPVLFYEGVLLMELVTDAEGQPAPRLVDATFSTAEAAADYYRDLRQQAVKMLCCDIIHGDLSAYNILLGAHGPTIIDFPQIVSAAANSRAEFFFKRDLDNLRLFFSAFDPNLRGRAGDVAEIWKAYVKRELTPDFEPSGRFVPEARGPREGGRPMGRPYGGGGRPFPPREHREPREHRPAPPPAAPPPEAPAVEDEFALLRQGGGERPKVAQLGRNRPGGDRPHRKGFGGGGRGGPPNRPPGGERQGPPRNGSAPHGGGGQGHPQGGRPSHGGGGQGPRAGGHPPRSHEPRPPRGPRPEGAGTSHPAEARGPHGNARPPSNGGGRPHGGHGGGRPPHGGPGPRSERPQGSRPPRQGGPGRRGAAPAVSYVPRAPEPAPGGSTEES